ncbi:MAG: cyclic nucleotide-binding/CBS domain-containing protein [Chloroflexaceae bacterium]|nr:cyclic nucleotide-binding/CBS domain-containing protein [Chloroflexaceae bacterium]
MEEIARFLQDQPPFNLLSFEAIIDIAPVTITKYVPEGQVIIASGDPPPTYLSIIRQGSVEMLYTDEYGAVRLRDMLGEGEIFGHHALIHGTPAVATVRSHEETLLYRLPAAAFQQLRQQSEDFDRFFHTPRRTLESLNVQHDSPSVMIIFQMRLGDIIRQAALKVKPTTTIHEAAQAMKAQNLTCVIVEDQPPGILTDRDLRNRVLSPNLSNLTPVSDVMTAPLLTLPAESLVFEGLMTMLERNVRHLPVTRDSEIIGVITDTDILRQQSTSPLILPYHLYRASTIEDFRRYNERVTTLVGSLLAAGTQIQDISRIVSAAHDALRIRFLRDAEAALGPPPCPYAWLLLGSEGRLEQIVRSDQDNALIYADEATAKDEEYFRQLAEYVVDKLIQSGFPPCPGNIMATNPRWRRPLRDWVNYFEDWIYRPDEEALLDAAIFFDYRCVYGKLDAEQVLRPIMFEGGRHHVFRNRLIQTALRSNPPIGFFRQFVLERVGDRRDIIDLKLRGTALFVDLGRIFALEAGCAATNTITRLQLSTADGHLSESGAQSLIAGFELVSRLRTAHQYEQLRHGETPDNQVSLSALSAWERRELKEALVTVGDMQQSIAASLGAARVV